MKSINNKLLLESYKGSGKIEQEVHNGFATVKQKSTLIGLVLVANANVDNINIPKGSLVFFEESVLFKASWAKTKFTASHVEGEFIVADSALAVGFCEI